MKTITLLFSTQKQLLEYYFSLGKIAFATDLKRLLFTAPLSQTDVQRALTQYNALLLTQETVHLVNEELVY